MKIKRLCFSFVKTIIISIFIENIKVDNLIPVFSLEGIASTKVLIYVSFPAFLFLVSTLLLYLLTRNLNALKIEDGYKEPQPKVFELAKKHNLIYEIKNQMIYFATRGYY